MSGRMEVLVIGAGIAGLGAAYALQLAGLDVIVFEAEAAVGGRMSSVQWAGKWIDRGAEFIAEKPVFDPLLRSLGLLETIQPFPGGSVAFDVWRDGEIYPLEYTNPASLMRFGAISTRSKLQGLKLLPALARQAWASRGHLFEPWRAAWFDNEQTTGTWLGRLAPELLEYAVEPTYELYCAYAPEDLSRAMFAHLTTSYVNSQLYTFPEGLGYLTRTVAGRLHVLTSTRALSVDAGSGKVVYLQEGDERRLWADYILVAVPGARVSSLVRGLDAARTHFFSQVMYTPAQLPYYDLAADPHIPSVFFPRREDDRLAALGYDRLSTDPVERVLRINLKSRHIWAMLDASDQEVLDEALFLAAQYYPQLTDLVTDAYLARWREGLPLFGPGYLRALKAFVKLPAHPRLAFAGDYLAQPSTGAAYASGLRAARQTLGQLAPDRLPYLEPFFDWSGRV